MLTAKCYFSILSQRSASRSKFYSAYFKFWLSNWVPSVPRQRALSSGPENYFWSETGMHPPVGAQFWSSGNAWCREGTGTLNFLVCKRLVRKVVSNKDGNRSVVLRHPLLRLVDQHKARGRNRRECEVRFWPSSFILRLSGRSKSGPCVVLEEKFFWYRGDVWPCIQPTAIDVDRCEYSSFWRRTIWAVYASWFCYDCGLVSTC